MCKLSDSRLRLMRTKFSGINKVKIENYNLTKMDQSAKDQILEDVLVTGRWRLAQDRSTWRVASDQFLRTDN